MTTIIILLSASTITLICFMVLDSQAQDNQQARVVESTFCDSRTESC